MSRYIDDLELKLWRTELEKAIAEERKAQQELDQDPTQIILDCNSKFAKLLEENQGEARHSKAFHNQVEYLAKLEKRAKARLATYDLNKVMNRLTEAQMKLNQVSTKYHNIEFGYRMRHKDVPIGRPR